jgi:plastocyanin
VAVVAFSVTACGGGEQPAGNRLDVRDYEFRPDGVAVVAGRQATIRVTNRGKVRHNISIPAVEADIDYEPGASTNLIFVAPTETGTIEFFCKYHRDRPMTGALFIR